MNNLKKMVMGLLMTVLVCLISVKGFSEKTVNDLDAKVDAILAKMSLFDKAGQMAQNDWRRLGHDWDVGEYDLGGIISGAGNVPYDNGPEGWIELINRMQAWTTNTDHCKMKIPIIWGIDAVHGNNNVEKAVIFPHNIGMGCTRNPALVEKAARVTAEEMVACGMKWNLAPCVAVARDIRWGRTYESYGEDPDLVSQMGLAALKGYQGTNLAAPFSVLATFKHYVADGATINGKNGGDVNISEQELRAIHLKPYVDAVKAGAQCIMVSPSGWNGQKDHASKKLITDILKKELGFQGFVVSDYNAIQGLSGDFKEQIRQAIDAGIDLVMVPEVYKDFITNVILLVNDQKLSMERIDDACRRIIKVKMKMGLFENRFASLSNTNKFNTAEHRSVARDCVRQSLVLLKNDKKTLPLSKTMKKVVLAGALANDIGSQCGGWTISWQGETGEVTKGTSILDAVKKALPGVDVSVIDDPSKASGAEAAIVVIGEKPYAEGFGDSANLAIDHADEMLIKGIKKTGVKVVTVLISGRPLIVTETLKVSDAFIAAWLPGTEGDGVADVLFGDYKPTGKLSFTWPKEMKQVPITKDNTGKQPLFEYGYGLTY